MKRRRLRRAPQRDVPLLSWGAMQHNLMATKRRLRRRLFFMAIGCTLVLMPALCQPRPFLIWNASASAPLGLYWVESAHNIRRGDMVAARLIEPYATLADQRHYLPRAIPLIKRVVAVDHDLVCAGVRGITVNDRWLASRRLADAKGRPMPSWHGCIRLEDGEIFLLMAEHPNSFDGRYFGATRVHNIIGKVTLLWPK